MIGATAGYAHSFAGGDSVVLELTALNGSRDNNRIYSGASYHETNEELTELRVSALYTSASFKYVSFGVEYILSHDDYCSSYVSRSKHLVNVGTSSRPDYQWDGTYTESVSSNDSSTDAHMVLAKTSVAYSWALFSKDSSSLRFKPRLDLAVGTMINEGDSKAAYTSEVAASFIYEFGRSSVILDAGYRSWGSFDAETPFKGVTARAGYAFRW